MIAILIGAMILILLGVINITDSGMLTLITFAVFMLIIWQGTDGFDGNYLAAELCGGGLMLGAFFMATDYVTSPITPAGQIILRYLLWSVNRYFPLFRSKCRGCFFCNHPEQYS